MLLRTAKRGVNPAIIRSHRDMYVKLRVKLKIPLKKDEKARPLDRAVPVKMGARYGARSSPVFFNSYVLEAQDQC
jgi:hypothetical protein